MMNKISVGDKDFEIFIENDSIAKRTRLIATELNLEYEHRKPIFIGILNGSFLFMADLLKEVEIPCEVGFMRVASYHGTETTGKVKQLIGIADDIKGRDIILVEDIVDTGLTLKFILEKVYEQHPASVKVCSLLYKPESLQTPIPELEYVGFEIPNAFVVGYGLDYDGLGRNLKDIYRVLPDRISLT